MTSPSSIIGTYIAYTTVAETNYFDLPMSDSRIARVSVRSFVGITCVSTIRELRIRE
jgi:hypothetical protein